MKLGAQLYTVRDFTKNLDDFAETLKKVADIGYTTVQVSGTCAFEADWLKEQLDKNGLQCVVTHNSADRILNDTDKLMVEHKSYDCRNIGIGWYNIKEAGIDNFVEKFHPVAQRMREQNMKFMYHNHDMEFEKIGKDIVLEQLANLFSAEELEFILDTYWVQAAGGDPAWWIRHLATRVTCVHFKDMSYGRKMAVVGEGNMNFDEIINACYDAKVQYILVEQDDCNGEDPFDCLRRSYEYLKTKGLE
jgi:sugar phosphate isomerase/epimerase